MDSPWGWLSNKDEIDLELDGFLQTIVAESGAPFLERLHAIGGPKCPSDKHRLEKQADKTSLICVEPEGADAVHVLADVAWENGNVEQREEHPHRSLVLVQEYHAKAENNLDNPRGQYHEIQEFRILRKPRWDLRQEFLPSDGQVTDTCIGHK